MEVIMTGPTYAEIERIARLPVEEFRRLYDVPMKPVVITGALTGWKAISDWSHEWFSKEYGQKMVGLSANPRHTSKVVQMRLADYISRILSGTDEGLYMNQYPTAEFPGLNGYYQIPEYCNPERTLDVVLWLGPAGTVLAFHKDNRHPYDWINNIFVQIRGRKQVVLASPEQDEFMYQRIQEGSDYWYSNIEDPYKVDRSKFPLFFQATLLQTVVYPGEILFIPANYWHWVCALDKSISMSFWWRRHRLTDIINRFFMQSPSKKEEFINVHLGTITMKDVEDFGGIARLADALDLLKEEGHSVMSLLDQSVRASLQRVNL
jgi:cupin-like protein